MKKIIVFLAMAMILTSMSFAAKVGIVISFPDGETKTDCVDISSGSDGYKVMEETIFDIEWSDKGLYGHAMCKVDDTGIDPLGDTCDWDGSKYWGFFTGGDNEWQYMPVGFDAGDDCWNGDLSSWDGHYCAEDRDSLGFRYGEWGDMPEYLSFYDVCKDELFIVKDIEVKVDGDKESGINVDGGTIDVIPKSKVEIEIELENLYTDEEDIEIQDISIEATLDGIDDDDDIEVDADEFDIRPEKTKKETLEFDIPQNVDTGTYDLEIKIEAKDSNNRKYEKTLNFDVEVDKEKHDIVFTKLNILKEKICAGEDNTIQIEVLNTGEKDEEIVLTSYNNDLKLNKKHTPKEELEGDEEDSKYSYNFNFQIPEDTGEGNYPILIKILFNNERDDVSKYVNLEVEECSIIENEQNIEKSNLNNNQQDDNINKESEQDKETTAEINKDDNMLWIPVIAGGVLIVLVLIGLIVAVLLG